MKVPRRVKTFHAKFSTAMLFGEDIDERARMADPDLEERFDSVWNRDLEAEVAAADQCDLDYVKEHLAPKQSAYIKADARHVQFELHGHWIGQVIDEELDQLWFVSSSAPNLRVLRVTFDTKAELDELRAWARAAGWENLEELALSMLTAMKPGRPKA